MINKHNQFYLSKQILDWEAFSEGGSMPSNNWKKPYSIWEHSKNILESNAGKLYLIDAITALKRCVDYRIKDLNEKYKLKTISASFKKSNMVEVLSELSIIKPLMLSKLIDIRNQLEHHDGEPPEHNRCHELLEFVWYFLKSTDYLCNLIKNSMLLSMDNVLNSPYSLAIDMGIEKNWNITFRGWVKLSLISPEQGIDFFPIEIGEQKNLKTFLISYKKKYGHSIAKSHSDKNLDDISVNGRIIDEPTRMKLIAKYFEIV